VLRSPCERIGAEPEVHDLGQSPFAAFDVERRSVAVGRPQSLALPARLRIIDAPIHILGAVGPCICRAQKKLYACSQVRKMRSQVVYNPSQTASIPVRPLPEKGKPVARRGRKATDQAWGLRAGLPKEGCEEHASRA